MFQFQDLISTLEGDTLQTPERETKIYRFDVFKGVEAEDGSVQKIKSVGFAELIDGTQTHTVRLKTLLKDVFYLMPDRKADGYDYVILTREDSWKPGRKYFWNHVGHCRVQEGPKAGLLKMVWDILATDDIYMSQYPMSTSIKRPRPQLTPAVQEAA